MGKSTVSPSSTGTAQSDSSKAIALSSADPAIQQFQKAAQVIEQKYPGALSAFQDYVQSGNKGQIDQQTQAQLANLPVSNTASAALDELRGFMGLPSISPTAGLSTSVNGIMAKLANDPNASQYSSQLGGIRDQLAQAENITDPAQREIAKQQIQSQLSQFTQSLPPQYSNIATELGSVSNQFNAGYGKDGSSIWSPDVIKSKLEADPGYQFRLQQGNQQMDRSAAAKGNLLSGNTMAAAQQFGQDMASQEYDKRISQLQNTVATQAPSINQQAGMLQNVGSTVGQTGQAMGTAAGSSGQAVANAGQQAANLGGQGLLQSSQLQGQMANQGALANAQLYQGAMTTNAQLAQQANLANQQTELSQNNGLLTSVLGKI